MLRSGSLRKRLIIFTTVPLIAILVTTLTIATHNAQTTVERSLQKSLTESGSLFVQLLSTHRSELSAMAEVTARDPRFFATFSIPVEERSEEFRPTLDGVAIDFLRIAEADFIEIFDANTTPITSLDRHGQALPEEISRLSRPGLTDVLRGTTTTDFYAVSNRVAVTAAAPVYVGRRIEAIVRFGRYLDEEFAQEFKRMTGTDVCMARDGRALAATFPLTASDVHKAQADRDVPTVITGESVAISGSFELESSGEDFLAIRVDIAGNNPDGGFEAFLGRRMETAMAPLVNLERRIAIGGLLAVLVTLIVGYLVAFSITEPLSRIVRASQALRDGDYDVPLDLRGKDEVATLARNFRDMREAMEGHMAHLENLDRTKGNFIALAGHELRTPLTIISGFSDLIADGALGEVPDAVRESTGVMKEKLTELNNLVQSMLDLTSLEQGLISLNLYPQDLRTVTDDAVAQRAEALESRNLTLTISHDSPDAWAAIDKERFTTAILTILDNAIRFTDDGGMIDVTTTVQEDTVGVAVTDTGVGIPPAELNWIFDKIYELGELKHHSSGRHRFGSSGFGIGLALCKAIVEAHGGNILVDSDIGRGSRFEIRVKRIDHTDSKDSVVVTSQEGELVS